MPEVRAAAAHHGLRLLRPQLRLRWWSASAITCRRAARTYAPAPVEACAPSRSCWPPAPSSGRWCSPTTTGPASCWPAAARTYVNRYGVAARHARVVVITNNDSAYAGGARPGRGRRDRRRHRRSPRQIADSAAVAAARAAQASRSWPAMPSPAPRAGTRVSAVVTSCALNEAGDGVSRRGAGDRLRSASCIPAAGTRPCICSRSPRGKLRFDDGIAAFVPDKSVQSERSAGACQRQLRARRLPGRGLRGRRWHAAARRRLRAALPARAARRSPAGTAEAPLRPIWLVPSVKPVGHGGKHFVDHQNDVTAADVLLAPPRGLPLGRAPQALHHHGHGHRPGQDQQRQRARHHGADAAARDIPQVGTTTFRPPYTPVTIGAFGGHERGDLLDPIRRTPLHHWHEQRRRHVRECRPVAARLVLSAPGREHARRGQPRGQGGAHRRRHPRRLDPRQDRHPGAGRRRAPELGLHQRLEQARDRPLPLRPDAAARTAWCSTTASPRASGRTALPDDAPPPAARRACSAGSRTGCRREWPDLRVYLHLRHRAVGHRRRHRAAARASCWPS